MKRLLGILAAAGFYISVSLLSTGMVQAVTGADWQAGRIIDDSTFTNAGTLSVAQIQDFLESKVPNCDSDHAESSNWRDMGPPYVCLKDYREDPTRPIRDCTQAEVQKYFGFGPSDSRYNTALTYCWWKSGRANLKGQVISSTNSQSAAKIIWKAAQAYSINPEVLIVTLQKEQSLLTDTWPWVGQFQKAMGYACPDSGSCDPSKRGLYNQVRNAAAQFRRYLDYPQNYNFAVGTRFIQYNPNPGCGGTNVKIQTNATAALYNYTPYQPNAAALNNLYGTGDGCSAYGNRNFWRLFNDIFGSTEGTPLFRIGNTAPVYILGSENNYYHITSDRLLRAYGYPRSIPKIAFVNSSYVQGRTLSGSLPEIARFEGSALYLIDNGERHWFNSEALLEDTYGYTLGEEATLPASAALYFPETDNVTPVIKEDGGAGIYLMEDGRKRHFTSLAAFQSGSPPYSARDFIRLTVDYTSARPSGAPIWAYMTMFRLNSSDAVYVINSDTKYLQIASKTVAGQYGFDLSRAMNMTTDQAAGYTSAGSLGFVTRKTGSSDAWLIQDGVKRRLMSAAMLASGKYNITIGSVPQLPASFVISFKTASGLSEVIQAESEAKVYLVENGAKRWARSWSSLHSLGYDESDLTIVSKGFVASLPTGTTIN